MTAAQFIEKLSTFRNEKEIDKVEKFFKGNDGSTKHFGVKFGDVFKTAEEFSALPLKEINKLLDNDFYEVRMGAVSIMSFQAGNKKTSEEKKKELFDLYLQRHDRLNNWDFVDRGARNIIGNYLIDKSRNILYQLAESENPWERRTAVVSTHAFIRKNDVEDTFKIAEILVHDPHELVNKAVGSWIREAGKKNPKRLYDFLDQYAKAMPAVTFSYAIEKLDPEMKEQYKELRKEK
ncbi:DNA alkylation repair protein [Chryseobacterium lathyri]|jgi:3-methyladenine DNA glycosylase AlkD|uniref:DNA alkylation repair protein n=1 Tax=Chryseobacterium lathyri TaxID=395933 RepID=A0A511Y5N4_9FLAO|nr:DNA alkylation repair protein [Chryseobacterium lathyri]GEN70513.1 DNA alkylation repair protein [Chryseobacterium lathyri]